MQGFLNHDKIDLHLVEKYITLEDITSKFFACIVLCSMCLYSSKLFDFCKRIHMGMNAEFFDDFKLQNNSSYESIVRTVIENKVFNFKYISENID